MEKFLLLFLEDEFFLEFLIYIHFRFSNFQFPNCLNLSIKAYFIIGWVFYIVADSIC